MLACLVGRVHEKTGRVMPSGILRALEEIAARPPCKRIHANHCAHCPSALSGPDPECEDIKNTYPREEQLETVFRCAWRPEKLCKGYCDYLQITESDL